MERDPPVFYRRDKKISRVIKGLFGLKPRQGYAIIAPMLTADKIFTKYTDYVQREVAGEFILIPIKRNLKEAGRLFVLNEMGALIWKQIDGERSTHDIASQFLAEFEVSKEEFEKDFDSLLNDLLSIQAIQEKLE